MKNDEKENKVGIIGYCLIGDLESVKECVQNGEDVNEKNIYGHSPLSISIQYGRTEIADYLKIYGAIR